MHKNLCAYGRGKYLRNIEVTVQVQILAGAKFIGFCESEVHHEI